MSKLDSKPTCLLLRKITTYFIASHFWNSLSRNRKIDPYLNWLKARNNFLHARVHTRTSPVILQNFRYSIMASSVQLVCSFCSHAWKLAKNEKKKSWKIKLKLFIRKLENFKEIIKYFLLNAMQILFPIHYCHFFPLLKSRILLLFQIWSSAKLFKSWTI